MQDGYKIEPIRLDTIRVDKAYQRESAERHAKKIAAAWDWDVYDPILVAEDDHLQRYIVDGQHRVLAAKELGFDTLPGRLIHSNRGEQAKSFVGRQRGRRALSAMDQFRAELVAGDSLALALNEAIEAAGFRVGTGGRSAGVAGGKVLFCIAEMKRHCWMTAKGEPRVAKYLIGSLDAAREAWGFSDPIDAGMMHALCRVFRLHQRKLETEEKSSGRRRIEDNRARFVELLSATSPSEIAVEAKKLAAKTGLGNREAMVLHLLRTYNKNLIKYRLTSESA